MVRTVVLVPISVDRRVWLPLTRVITVVTGWSSVVTRAEVLVIGVVSFEDEEAGGGVELAAADEGDRFGDDDGCCEGEDKGGVEGGVD